MFFERILVTFQSFVSTTPVTRPFTLLSISLFTILKIYKYFSTITTNSLA